MGGARLFQRHVYYGGVSDQLQAFTFSQAKLAAMPSSSRARPTAIREHRRAFRPTARATRSCGRFRMEHRGGVLHAYDATNLGTELYNSITVPADSFGGQQVRHADHRERQGLRRHSEQRRRVRTKALTAASASLPWLAAINRSISACSLRAMRTEQYRGAVRAAGINLASTSAPPLAIQDFRLASDQRVCGRSDKQYRRANVTDRFGHYESAEAGRR